MPHLLYGSHSITCHTKQANPSLPYMGGGPDFAYYCRNLPGGGAGAKLYRLVNRGTFV